MPRPYRGATDEAIEAWQAAMQAGTARLGPQLAITLVSAVLLGVACAAVLSGAMAFFAESDAPTLGRSLAFLGGALLAVTLGSVVSVTQRALVIVDLEGPQAPRGRASRQVGGTLGIALAIAAIDAATIATCGIATMGRVVPFGVLVFGAWWILRGVVGVATARVTLELERPLEALWRSAKALGGLRIASTMSRLPIGFLAGLELFLASRVHDVAPFVVLSVVLGACATTVDGWIEHAWHRRLRPETDRAALAAVFE